MTNSTKKRTKAGEDRPSTSQSTTPTDPEGPTLEELQERNKELERRLRKYKGMSRSYQPLESDDDNFHNIEKQKRDATGPAIKPIIRPRGEAGSRKRGFILYHAMGMDKVENGPVVYDRMRVCVLGSG
jgi:hypothetical protein